MTVLSLAPVNHDSRVFVAATVCQEEPTQAVDTRRFDSEFTSACVEQCGDINGSPQLQYKRAATVS